MDNPDDISFRPDLVMRRGIFIPKEEADRVDAVYAALEELFRQHPVEQSIIHSRLSQPLRRHMRNIKKRANIATQERCKSLELARIGQWYAALRHAELYCCMPHGTVAALRVLLRE